MILHLSSEDVEYVDINITNLCQMAPRFLIRRRSWFATVVCAFMCNVRHERSHGALTKCFGRSASQMASSRC